MNIIKQENLNVLKTRFEENCSLRFSVRKSDAQKIKGIFENLYGVKINQEM